MHNWGEKWFWALTVGLYTATAFAYLVLPLGTRWGGALLGTALFAPDAILNAGILEWGYRSLWSPALYIFDWTAGFPLANSLASTENLIGWQVFYSPLRWAGVNNVAAYNVLIVASFVISGIGAALLARQLGANRYGACIAGFIFAFVPFHLNHIVHLQTMAVCWSPFAFLFLDRFLSSGSTKDAVALGATFILTTLSGIYFGVFLLLVLPMYLCACYAFGRYRFKRRTLSVLAATSICAAILLLPIIIPYARFALEHGLKHRPDEIVRFSVAILDIFKVPPWQAVWSNTWLAQDSNYKAAFPGLTALILAGFFVFPKGGRKDHNRLRLILALLCIGTFVLSLGPELKIQGNSPLRLAGLHVPLPGAIFVLLSAVRVPMRILFFSFLFGAVLAGLGLSTLTERLSKRFRIPVALLALSLLAVEYRPQAWFARSSVTVPEPLAFSDAYPFLAQEADTGGVVELPSSDENNYRTPVMTRYTYGSAGHLRRVVAFHGSVRPPVLDRLQNAADQLPDNRARNLLLDAGVTRLVVHRRLMKASLATQKIAALDGVGYRRLYEGSDAVVFALNPPGPARLDPSNFRATEAERVTGIALQTGKVHGRPQ